MLERALVLNARRSKSHRRHLAPRLQREPAAQLDRLLDTSRVRRAASRVRCSAKPGDPLTLQPGRYEATTGTPKGGRSGCEYAERPTNFCSTLYCRTKPYCSSCVRAM